MFGYASVSGLIDRVKPSQYDVLACLNLDNSEDFKDFCANFGYDDDSLKAHKTYKAVKEESQQLKMLFNDKELELLSEVQ